MASTKVVAKSSKKRKLNLVPENEDDKLEIDVDAPEPPSKKAKRKEKKQSKSKPTKQQDEVNEGEDEKSKVDAEVKEESGQKVKAATASSAGKRSEYGIWIGNLPFAATRESIRKFLLNEANIGDSDITRVHMPTAEKGQNKGFAYVDFTTPAILETALTLSERMIQGRSVLIKNSKSFEGRPQKSVTEQSAAGNVSKKERSKRIFVGNLSFDVIKEELAAHFAQAGQVENVHMATFEDTGKCKGFGWITFADIEAAKCAVRGFIFKDPQSDDEESGEDGSGDERITKGKNKKPKKARKWFINRIHGRELRCEFAEDAQTRYKKRFTGGGSRSRQPEDGTEPMVQSADGSRENDAAKAYTRPPAGSKKKDPKMKAMSKDERQEERRKRFDARLIAPGRAHANKTRASEAIVAGTGSKKTFE